MKYVEGAYEVEQMPGEEELIIRKKSSAPAPGPVEPSRTDNDPVWQAMEARDNERRAARKAKRDKAVSEILAARKAVPARDIGRNQQGLGNFYDPLLAAKKEDPDDPYYMGDEQAAKYNARLGGAKPTTKFDAANDDDKKKWQIFQKMIELEGRVGTVKTFDNTLSIGVGFSSAGTQGNPPALLVWPIDSVALAVHSRHMSESIFPWSFWEAQTSTAVRELVRAIYLKPGAVKKRSMFLNICNSIYDPRAKAVKAEEDAKEKAEAAAAKPDEPK